jgi:hypothetical protein
LVTRQGYQQVVDFFRARPRESELALRKMLGRRSRGWYLALVAGWGCAWRRGTGYTRCSGGVPGVGAATLMVKPGGLGMVVFTERMLPEVMDLFWGALERGETVTDAAKGVGTYREKGGAVDPG